MSKEIRGMLLGLCIVILAVAAYVLRDRPARPTEAPGGPAPTSQRPSP
ncbi:hypothetical protein [Reyranella sp.]